MSLKARQVSRRPRHLAGCRMPHIWTCLGAHPLPIRKLTPRRRCSHGAARDPQTSAGRARAPRIIFSRCRHPLQLCPTGAAATRTPGEPGDLPPRPVTTIWGDTGLLIWMCEGDDMPLPVRGGSPGLDPAALRGRELARGAGLGIGREATAILPWLTTASLPEPKRRSPLAPDAASLPSLASPPTMRTHSAGVAAPSWTRRHQGEEGHRSASACHPPQESRPPVWWRGPHYGHAVG
jgi:hypothetical protein